MKTFLHRWIPAVVTIAALVSLVAPSFHAQITQPPAGVADLLFTPDATWDIGKTGATRARDLFISRNGTVGGTLGVTGVLTAPGVPVLLKANSGTDTTAGATNVDTIATGALTAKDTLVVEVTMNSVTQATAQPSLFDTTDSVSVVSLQTGAIAAGSNAYVTARVRVSPASNTAARSYWSGHDATAGTVTGDWAGAAIATGWTTGFTLALRHNGVTAGGTFQWAWAVYKIPGQ